MKPNKETICKLLIYSTTFVAVTLCATCLCDAAAYIQPQVSQQSSQDAPQAISVAPLTADKPEENENERIAVALYAASIDGGTFTATAYCKCRICCGEWADVPGTYTGAEPREGVTIAVDPKVIPLNSVVFVETADGTVHEYVAEDIGGAIKGRKIDVYHDTHDAALAFGRQTVRVRYVPYEE